MRWLRLQLQQPKLWRPCSPCVRCGSYGAWFGAEGIVLCVGDRLYLYNNQLVNINGLSSLANVGGNLNIENNQLSSLDGLNNLTALGGYLALRSNPSLTDISGASNITGNNGQILYIDLDQYTTKANENLEFCQTAWDLRTIDGDIDDNLTLVCGEGTGLTDIQKLRLLLNNKCAISYSQFEDNYETSTGKYNGSIDCSYSQINDEELSTFNILTEITGGFSLDHNDLTNLDGLVNLNKVGGYLYINSNQIGDINGISNLAYVGKTFDISDNNISNLNALFSLNTIGEAFKIYHNNNLEDILGLSNVKGVDGKKIYIDPKEYLTLADLNEAFCSAKWDIYDTNGNIDDNMSKLCEGYSYIPDDEDLLRDVLGKQCSIDSLSFYSNYVVDGGIYTGNITCTNLIDTDMNRFGALLEVNGSLTIENSEITNLDGLYRLKKVTNNVSIWNNSNLTNIQGLSNTLGIANQKLTIDSPYQYEIKADGTKEFCNTQWNLYEGLNDIPNDMRTLCTE